MPEVTFQTVMKLPVGDVWAFVQEMDNWAPMLTGYQEHEKKSETQSIWTLKGDVGILSRRVKLEVNITEWIERERVSFTLTGLNEQVEGDGTFIMSAVGAARGAGVRADAAPEPIADVAAPKRGPLRRFVFWLFRAVFRRKFGEVERAPVALEDLSAVDEAASLSFRLRMDALGPMAPMVNAMLEPALEPAAEDLANKIAAHLEGAVDAEGAGSAAAGPS